MFLTEAKREWVLLEEARFVLFGFAVCHGIFSIEFIGLLLSF